MRQDVQLVLCLAFIFMPLKLVSEFYLNLFIEGRLRNKLFQLILITLDRSFRMVSIFFVNEV